MPEGKPYALAGLMAAAIQSGMHPREWEGANCRSAVRQAQRAADFISGRAIRTSARCDRRRGSEEDTVDTTYHRHRPSSRLEQLLAHVVHCDRRPREQDFRVDFVSDVGLEIIAADG